MDDLTRLLHAVRQSAADDTPRLILADYLDDRGDATWAELIRLQIDLEPRRYQLSDRQTRADLKKEAKLLKTLRRNQVAWRTFPQVGEFGPIYRRGVPELLGIAADRLKKHHTELFEQFPTLSHLALFSGPRGAATRSTIIETLQAAVQVPELAQLEHLEICGTGLPSAIVRVLAEAEAPFQKVPERTLWYTRQSDYLTIEELLPRLGPTMLFLADPEARHLPWDQRRVRGERVSDRTVTLVGDCGHGFYAGQSGEHDQAVLVYVHGE
ncbi:MAG: TIGR02996 domain-containing protein, partial [Gemmataceae bacterium]